MRRLYRANTRDTCLAIMMTTTSATVFLSLFIPPFNPYSPPTYPPSSQTLNSQLSSSPTSYSSTSPRPPLRNRRFKPAPTPLAHHGTSLPFPHRSLRLRRSYPRTSLTPAERIASVGGEADVLDYVCRSAFGIGTRCGYDDAVGRTVWW